MNLDFVGMLVSYFVEPGWRGMSQHPIPSFLPTLSKANIAESFFAGLLRQMRNVLCSQSRFENRKEAFADMSIP